MIDINAISSAVAKGETMRQQRITKPNLRLAISVTIISILLHLILPAKYYFLSLPRKLNIISCRIAIIQLQDLLVPVCIIFFELQKLLQYIRVQRKLAIFLSIARYIEYAEINRNSATQCIRYLDRTIYKNLQITNYLSNSRAWLTNFGSFLSSRWYLTYEPVLTACEKKKKEKK